MKKTFETEGKDFYGYEEELLKFFTDNPKSHTYNAEIHYKDGTVSNRRMTVHGRRTNFPQIMLYYKRSRTRGMGLNITFPQIQSVTLIVPSAKSPEEKWQKSWEKVIKRLEKSGLWDNILEEAKLALEIGYAKMRKAYEIETSWGLKRERRIALVKEIDPRFMAVNSDGVEYSRSSFIWQYANVAKVKKMYFGKHYTSAMAEVAEILDSGEGGHVFGFSSYDVSFEYNSISKKAWYSEEYRGCGNGHYYIAMDATHALFIEDD